MGSPIPGALCAEGYVKKSSWISGEGSSGRGEQSSVPTTLAPELALDLDPRLDGRMGGGRVWELEKQSTKNCGCGSPSTEHPHRVEASRYQYRADWESGSAGLYPAFTPQ